MGYSTIRNIHINTGSHSPHEISLAFSTRFNICTTGVLTYVSNRQEPYGEIDFDGVNARTWYSEVDDLTVFSKQFPTAEIFIKGIGEAPDDVWERLYKNGVAIERTQSSSWSGWTEIAT